MRRFKKVAFYDSWTGDKSGALATEYKDFAKDMDGENGYESNDSYQSKEKFFNKYFKLRYIDWDHYLRKNIKKDDEIFSISSGRCINELRLINDGYSISCSDLGKPPHYDKSVKLFGPFPFTIHNSLKQSPNKLYDVVWCLSAIHYFDYNMMDKFFHNVNKGVKLNGFLYVDPGGAPDSIFTFLWDEFFIPVEHKVFSFIYKFIWKKEKTLVKHDLGFRNNNQNIIESATKSGFEFVSLEELDFLDEFRRSVILRALIERSSIVERILSILGRKFPLIRIFKFKKINNIP
jgi:hypothetical protein